ncbi:MAG: hypothetical protein K5979_04990 [Ruminococcus sp.]|nr:hypothetical protein [Ruminococcus sp.]
MDKIVAKLAGLGVPALVFIAAISATGLTGAAAITAGLAALGPGGIVGGIAFLGVAGTISSAIAEYGSEALLKGVIKELYLQGESKESIKAKIEKYPVSKKLKLSLYSTLDSFKI